MPYRSLRLRYPYQIYLLVFAGVSSIPGALGQNTNPQSINAQLSAAQVRFWSIGLLIGCATALLGMVWSQRNAKSQITGLTLEQAGLVTCGFATLIYAAAVFMTFGFQALVSGGLIIGFSFASFAQAKMLHDAVVRAVKVREVQGR